MHLVTLDVISPGDISCQVNSYCNMWRSHLVRTGEDFSPTVTHTLRTVARRIKPPRLYQLDFSRIL